MKMESKIEKKIYAKEFRDYTIEALDQVKTVTDWLNMNHRDEMTTESETLNLKEWDLILTPLLGKIINKMRLEWYIFEGGECGPKNKNDIRNWPVNAENLSNLSIALSTAINKKLPRKISFLFNKNGISIQQNKNKPSLIAKRGTYQEGLLKALIDQENGRFGFDKKIDGVLETIYKNTDLNKRNLNTLASKKLFIRGVFREIQRTLKTLHLGGVLTLKWNDNLGVIRLKEKQ